MIDFGAMLDGYHSDMTRVVAVGDVGPERRKMLEVVADAQAAAAEAGAFPDLAPDVYGFERRSRRGSGRPASRKPFARSLQAGHSPQGGCRPW